jgi:hypothetical protein
VLLLHEGHTFCNRRDCSLVAIGHFMQVLLASISYFVSLEGMVIIWYDWLEIRVHVHW